MATRDLTKDFLAAREKRKLSRPRPSGPTPSPAGDGPAIKVVPDAVLLENAETSMHQPETPPDWVGSVQEIDNAMLDIQGHLKELAQLHRKRLLVSFNDEGEAAQEREIDMKTSKITSMFRNIEKVVSGLAKQTGEESQDELRVRRNLQRSMAYKVNQLSTQFRSSQKEYLQKLSIQKEGNSDGWKDILHKPTGGVEGGEEGEGAKDTGFTHAQMQEVENIDMMVNERDEEIMRIAKSIEELAGIMKELAALVIDQGTILDRIDYNMDAAVEHVKQGVVELEQAEKNQKAGNPIKCIAALMVLIAILIILLIAKHSNGRKRW